eukprot:6792967-Prymnesium_polylepis.1
MTGPKAPSLEVQGYWSSPAFWGRPTFCAEERRVISIYFFDVSSKVNADFSRISSCTSPRAPRARAGCFAPHAAIAPSPPSSSDVAIITWALPLRSYVSQEAPE